MSWTDHSMKDLGIVYGTIMFCLGLLGKETWKCALLASIVACAVISFWIMVCDALDQQK